MSQWRGRLEDSDELERAVDLVQQYYHLAFGALLLGFTLWNRVRPWNNYIVDGEVLFNGNDAWYHYRSTAYTVRNWPQTMPFDPWTYFPHGTDVGQFGTLFDQLLATVALIVGLGSPSDNTIRLVVLFAPAVFAVLTGIPTYVIGRRLGGRAGGVVALAVFALSAGSILQRSMVGFSDHHIAEVLFQTLGVLGMMVAVTVARRDRPVYEQFLDRDFDGLRSTLVWSALAGVAITLYLWVWPFGVLLLGIVGVYLLFQLTIEFVRGESPEHTAIAGAVALGVTGVLMFIPITAAEFRVGVFSLLHPTLAFGVAAGCVFMAWLARFWDDRDIDTVFYPLTILSILVLGVVFAQLATPGIYDLFARNLVRIFGGVLGIGPSATAGTIGEITPMRRPAIALFQMHGFATFIALAAGALVVVRNLIGSKVEPQQLLVVVWAAFVTAATITQARFAYYLAVPIGGLTAYAVGAVLRYLADGDRSIVDGDGINVETYQVLTVAAIAVLVVAPMVAVASPTDIDRYDSPGQGIEGWSDGLDWMQNHTPAEGTFGGASNELDHYGTFPNVGDFDYEDGQYGVLSWWDYGHWITAQGQRIPTANPFQQGATEAANFLLAPNETQANDALDTVSENSSEAETRYVAVDWKMAETNGNVGGKFFAPPNFYDVSEVSQQDYYSPVYSSRAQSLRGPSFVHQRQAYYNSTVVRLYRYHGSAVEPRPIGVDWEPSTLQGRQVAQVDGQRAIFQTQTLEEARAYTANDSTSSVGGIGALPSERVPAMEHYRLVGTSEQSATASGQYNRGLLQSAAASGLGYQRVNSTAECTSDVTLRVAESGPGQIACLPEGIEQQVFHDTAPQWLKVFERVPGATVEGTGPENATVQASVEMYNPASDETFTYTQQTRTSDDGTFTMTVPYSTTGYDEFGPDNGYTNVSVRANSSYQFRAGSVDNRTLTQWSGTTDVSEGQVLGVDEEPAEVEMNSSEIDLSPSENETDGTNTTSDTGNSETTDGTDGSETTDETTTSTPTATPEQETDTATESGN
ncbi:MULTISPECIES: oligosaccharyl transferase, archaeosortase A system-associated [Halomicrobium]|uniref:dolichyl-phosphooligosaccharide-protein glycotransferase n=2 Tax=Halomicrobium mukohataei TaxID=57705 RepID=C7P065_HALMD|nr:MULTISPECIES: oligosaccharyl transferase, archaeosortase A system-associated [Halomicrobium]ACV48857.1 Oligosaccharyl transferase STT3 subunit [Halomicrobium mukohataei DSM 12286]QCD64286.1 oligosaccharyl transferase, archaeosortase A system-associated [Halomicrobium mukohataei]QFR19092.1 oligosaccharyl transferase, archaeosortase A system-associated [Halomicrobium sp. ZPS1]